MYPILTFSNIISQALIHRNKNKIESTDLGVVLEHMTRTTNWMPSIGIIRKGLSVKHYTYFTKHASEKTFPEKTSIRQPLTTPWYTPRNHGRRSPLTTQHDRAGDVQDGAVLQGARALHPPLRRPDAARDPPLAHAVRRASRAHTVGRDGPSGARREQGEEGAVAGEFQWE